MPRKRLSMRKIREVLRLKYSCNCSIRKISESCGIGKGTVGDDLNRAKAAGLNWPLPDKMSDTCLEQQLFPSTAPQVSSSRFVPDFHAVHKEQHPDGYQYSWFCHSYRDWTARLDVVMRHVHRAGEKLFVDYTGQTVAIIDSKTGEAPEKGRWNR